MSDDFYAAPADLAPATKARSSDINAISQAVAGAFHKLPSELALKAGTVNYAVNTGTTGAAYKAQLDAAITEYTDGLEVKMRPVKDNTGPCTLNVNGLGNIAIKRADGTDPQAGDILGAAPITLVYQATGNVFRLPAVVQSQIIQAAGASASAQASAAAAAASAATVLKTLAWESIDPPADPIEGQEWIDAVTGRRFTYIESQWAETYASQVIDQPALVDALSGALQLANYAALRAYVGLRQAVYVTGYLATSAPSGIAGMFVRDDSDVASADNGGTIIVAANGKRWKRQADHLSPRQFGAIGDGISRPLSAKYATLAAAKIDFPVATSLNQETDWCAVVGMFRQQKKTNQEVRLLAGNWYLADPLEVIGTATAQQSIEKGNFRVMGESMHNTTLIFNFADDSKSAVEFINNGSGFEVANFRVTNLAKSLGIGNFGTGIKFSGVYTTTARDLQAFNFNVGIDKLSYVASFTNVVGTNCNAGVWDRGGTSTVNIAVYGASCRRQVNETRVYDYIGCGSYITGGIYSKFIGCAADNNDIAYKIKTTDPYGGTNPIQRFEFDNCGMEVCDIGYMIDAPQAVVIISNPSGYNLTSNKLAHVENAIKVRIRSFSDNGYHKVTLGANVGPGVVDLENGFGTGGNPNSFPLVNVPSVGGWGIDDFAYEGLGPLTTGAAGAGAATPMAVGRMITAKNQIEFELYARGNGAIANARIEVRLLHNYSGANIDRSGTVDVCASNATGYIETGCVSKTNPNISVTETPILDGTNASIGMRYLIKPFNGLASNATNTVAFFRVETIFNPVGADGQGKNHNIKLLGTYTGRVNCRLKGVDY